MQVLFYDLDSKNVVKEVKNMEFLFIILIILLDQISKYATIIKLAPISSIEIINGILSFTYVENRGAAFGIFRGKKFYLIGITSMVVILMIYYLIKNNNVSKYFKLSLILIIGGAIGNLIDRIFRGYVVDFIHFYIKDIFDWPVFNFADICVVLGTILMAVIIIFSKEKL